jgi:hypothetical protein
MLLRRTLETAIQKTDDPASKIREESFRWLDDPAAQKLLDVVAIIIVEEYIQTVRKHPETFREAK